MPMLGIGHSKDKIDHFTFALLNSLDCLWRSWMTRGRAGRAARLGEDPRPVGESISNWRPESPEDLTQGFFELFIYDHMLVDAKVLRRKLGECRNRQVWILIPIGGQLWVRGRERCGRRWRTGRIVCRFRLNIGSFVNGWFESRRKAPARRTRGRLRCQRADGTWGAFATPRNGRHMA